MKTELHPITIENARISFRNFSGKKGTYNPEGKRNFVLFIEDDRLAREMERDGWNVRWLEPKEEGEEKQPIITVGVTYNYKPPKVVLVTSRGQTSLGEDELAILDWAEIINLDLTIRPYEWDFGGKNGISAKLKTMYATIQEDPLEAKYEAGPDSAQNCIGPDCEVPPWKE